MGNKEKNAVQFAGSSDQVIWKSPVAEVGLNTELIVPFSHEAILIKNGQALETFKPGRYLLNEDTTPFFGSLSSKEERAVYGIYFINTTVNLRILWGTPSQLDLFDALLKMPVRVGASGEFELKVLNPRKLLMKVAGDCAAFTTEDLSGFFRSRIAVFIKDDLAKAMIENKISYYEIAANLRELSTSIAGELEPVFEEYGVSLESFGVNSVTIPEETRAALERAHLARIKGDIQGETAAYCGSCGANTAYGALFCSKCGAKL